MARPLLNNEDIQRVLGLMEQRHGRWLKDEKFEISAHRLADLVVAKITLSRRDRTNVYEMEAAVDTTDTRFGTIAEALDVALDFLDWYLGEYFGKQRELLLPLDFKPHRFGEYEVVARGDLKNKVLDDLAEAWLRGDRPEVPKGLKVAH